MEDNSIYVPEDPNTWCPKMSNKQAELFNSYHRYIIAFGTRASGKTYIAAHKIVRHAWEENGADVMIVTNIADAGHMGIWSTLTENILPEWVAAIGLQHTAPKYDAATKIAEIQITNQHGTQSIIRVRPFKTEKDVIEKSKGYHPSFILIEEAAELPGPTPEQMYPKNEKIIPQVPVFWTSLDAQLDRNPKIKFHCLMLLFNPDPIRGKRNWVYQWLWGKHWEEMGEEQKKKYLRLQFKVKDNPFLPQDAFDKLKENFKGNPNYFKSWYEGEWVAVSGEESMFPTFQEDTHVLGSVKDDEYIIPDTAYPEVYIGYDLGTVNHGIVFLQKLGNTLNATWSVFDELIYDHEQTTLDDICNAILTKMDFWEAQAGCKFNWNHISDTSAMEHYNHHTGSFDHMVLETLSKGRIRLEPCPKPPGSISARVNLVKRKIMNNQFFVSAKCEHVITTLSPDGLKWSSSTLRGGADKFDDAGYFRHTFDAMTYPMLAVETLDGYLWTPDEKQLTKQQSKAFFI